MDPAPPDDHAADDERDVCAAQDGDVRALEALLDRHQSRVFRVLSLMGVPADERDDVAQEVFIRIFRHLSGYERGRRFDSWVYRISVNAAHDFRSRYGGRTVLDPQDPAVARRIEAGADPTAAPDARLASEEAEREMGRLLEGLSERERAIFVLCELENRPTRQVARDLSISVITVRRHLGRARKALRRRLEEI